MSRSGENERTALGVLHYHKKSALQQRPKHPLYTSGAAQWLLDHTVGVLGKMDAPHTPTTHASTYVIFHILLAT